VAKTPSMLPILREAGVVDAGGQGLFRLLQGALKYMVAHNATPPPAAGRTAAHGRIATLAVPADEGFGYETMFLLQTRDEPLDIERCVASSSAWATPSLWPATFARSRSTSTASDRTR
jgi:dihydroxyacetone kinase-like predicted kinase